ncbi:MAG: SET domain-containing protein [Patescibacteria group bacterium]
MMHIAYKIQSSKTHGIGLFAGQDIKSGDLIYTPSPLLDTDITPEEFESLAPSEKREVMYYGYFNKKTNRWHVAFDAIRILNHGAGNIANVTQDEDMIMTAKRAIFKEEELLQDYLEIYPDGSEHFDRINKN